jgi:hypothetical protein
MYRYFWLLLGSMLLGACTAGKVVPLDSKTGYFPSSTKAKVVLNKTIDLDSRKILLVIPNDEFTKGQIENLHYFNEVIKVKDLETEIIKANLTDKIPSLNDRIGLNNAAKYYKNFLWFRWEKQTKDRVSMARFVLTDPVTMEDYFITETELDYQWKGVNDQYNWYPMFNAFLDYIKTNSKTYASTN